MLKEGDMYPNGNLFGTQLEGVNRSVGDRKIFIIERSGRSPRDEEEREAIFWGEREIGKRGLMGISVIGDKGLYEGKEETVW